MQRVFADFPDFIWFHIVLSNMFNAIVVPIQSADVHSQTFLTLSKCVNLKWHSKIEQDIPILFFNLLNHFLARLTTKFSCPILGRARLVLCQFLFDRWKNWRSIFIPDHLRPRCSLSPNGNGRNTISSYNPSIQS